MINDACWLSCASQVRPAEPRDVAAENYGEGQTEMIGLRLTARR